MKLQKRFLRKYGKKDYYKYMVNIPPMMVKEAGFKEGEELDIQSQDGKIMLKRKKSFAKDTSKNENKRLARFL